MYIILSKKKKIKKNKFDIHFLKFFVLSKFIFYFSDFRDIFNNFILPFSFLFEFLVLRKNFIFKYNILCLDLKIKFFNYCFFGVDFFKILEFKKIGSYYNNFPCFFFGVRKIFLFLFIMDFVI